MRLSVIHVCEAWMGATDLFTYNPQPVLVQCLNNYKHTDGRASLLKPYRVLDLVPLSLGCHKEPCCNTVGCHQQNGAHSKPCARSMALILPLPTGPEVAMSTVASNGLENMWADKFILS